MLKLTPNKKRFNDAPTAQTSPLNPDNSNTKARPTWSEQRRKTPGDWYTHQFDPHLHTLLQSNDWLGLHNITDYMSDQLNGDSGSY